MTTRLLKTTFSAVALGLILAGAAQAYPSTSGTTTTTRKSSTDNYRPLTLSFDKVYEAIQIQPESDVITYSSGVDLSPAVTGLFTPPLFSQPPALPGAPPLGLFRYSAVLGGSFTTTGASSPGGTAITGDAGYWLLVLDPNWMQDFTVDYDLQPNLFSPNPPSYQQTATADANAGQQRAGFLVYLGEDTGDDNYAGVPEVDTPLVGDLFWLYLDEGESMEFQWDDFVGDLDDFLGGSGANKATSTASDTFEHLGPYRPFNECNGDWRACAYDGLYGTGAQQLDLKRLNAECGTEENLSPCGTVSVSAVPLPAALPLFGAALGLLALAGWRRKTPG